MNNRIIALGALTALLAVAAGCGEPDDSIPKAAPSNSNGACEEQTDGTAWQPAALSTQNGDAWQPPTDPHAVGEEFVVGDWAIAVTNISYDAGDCMADLLEQPPPGDHLWVVAVATLRYDGAEPAGSTSDLESRYVGADGDLYEAVDLGAGTSVAAGQIITGASIIPVPPDQVAGGIWGIAAGVADPGVDDLVYVR